MCTCASPSSLLIYAPVRWSMHPNGSHTHPPKVWVPVCCTLYSQFVYSQFVSRSAKAHACCPAGGSAHVRTEVQGQCKNWACQVSFCLLLFPLQGLQQLLKIFTFLLCCLISWHICFWSCFVTPWSLQSSSLLSCLSPSSQPRVRLQLGLQALQRSPALQSRSEPVLQEDL